MKSVLVGLVFFASSLSSAALYGQMDETRIRSDAGGLYQSPAFGQGSVTSFLSAKVILRDPAGNALDERTVQQWKELVLPAIYPPIPNPIVATTTTSGGQTTIRFDYKALSNPLWFPSLPGGTVEIVYNGALIDRDRLYR